MFSYGSLAVLTMTNTTVAANSAAGSGGGLYNTTSGTAKLTNTTISGNSAANGGGVDIVSGTAHLGNTIVAGNAATTSGPDVKGTFASGGHNLIGKTDGSSGWVASDLTGTIASPLNPLLGAMGNNGGSIQTMALLTGSPAIGAGSNSIAGLTVPTTDERGLIRGTTVDIGAFQSSLVVESSSGTLDGTPAAGTLTLPDAVSLADQFAGSAITFDPSVFSAPTTITLTGTQLALTNTTGSQTITGPAAGVTVSGGGLSRVFQVNASVTAAISGLTITGGHVTGKGGGLYNEGTTTLTDVTVSADSASTLGGGLYTKSGGAITLTDCTVSGNTAGAGGGGLYSKGTTTLTDCTVSSNTAVVNGGGGLESNFSARPRSTIAPSAATPP